MRRIVTLLAVVLFGFVSLGTAAPATAFPPPNPWFGNCSYHVDYQARQISGYCDGGGGAKFYVFLECKSPLWPYPYAANGTVRVAGGGVSSTASCGNPVVDAGLVKIPDI